MSEEKRVIKKFKIRTYTGSKGSCVSCGKPIINGQEYVEVREDDKKEVKIPYRVGNYHYPCFAKRNYFIAFLDILGFRRFAENHDLFEQYATIQNMFVAARATRVEGSIRVDNSRSTMILSDIPYIAISDSIIVYQEIIPHTDTDDEFEWKERAFKQFIIGLEELFKESFRRKIFLRGGISYGEAIISLDSESREHIILGNPYLEAVETEKTQSWMGVAFHPSMNDYLGRTRNRTDLVEYQIPISEQFVALGIPNVTIGWVNLSMAQDRGIFDEWVTENDRHDQIKANTIQFFDYYIKHPTRIRHIQIDTHIKL